MLERNILDDNLTLSAYVLRQRLEGREPTIGLVLGSGLNPPMRRASPTRRCRA